MTNIDIKAIRAIPPSIRITGVVIDKTTVLALCDEIERLRKDAARYQALMDLVDEGEASVIFYGRLDTINTGLEVNSAGDLCDELEAAIDAAREDKT